MIKKFSEWVEGRRIDESFTSNHQSPGDMVYFGAHDILGMPDEQPLERGAVGQKLSVIKAVGPKGCVLDAPEKHGFRARSVKKFMSKDGGFTIPPDHLQEISPKLIAGGLGDNSETGKPQRLFIFTPNAYTKKMLMKKNTRMMSADAPETGRPIPPPAPQAHGNAPGGIMQAQLPAQPQLPAPGQAPQGANFQYGEGRSYRYY